MIKKITQLLAILLLLSNSIYAQYQSITVDGLERTYLVHLPPAYSDSNPLPLVLAFHGGTGNAFNLQNQSQLSNKADSDNFIVVYPEGSMGGILNVRTWNAGWCCGNSSATNVDDVGFVNALMDQLIIDYAIDTERIYATGLSNGGFLAYRLACELSHRIAAIAPVGCSIAVNTCEPNRVVPIIDLHSYEDTQVPYQGGIGDGISNHYNPPLDSLLNAWSVLNDCQTLEEVVVDNEEFTFTRWSNCSCDSEIHFYNAKDGGHSWPGGIGTPNGDPPSVFLNGNDLIWDFFQNYTLSCTPNEIKEVAASPTTAIVYPNPSNGYFTIQFDEIPPSFSFMVYNSIGELVLYQKEETQFDLNTHPVGVYFLHIQSDQHSEIHKIILGNNSVN